MLSASVVLVVLLASGVAFALIVDCMEGENFCVGTNKDDTINGSEVTDHIYGLAGADEMFGNGGDDEAFGGKGIDTIRGGEGVDDVEGGRGPDKLYGEGGNDDMEDQSWRCTNRRGCFDEKNLLDGGEGNDYLFGYTKLYGGPGDDDLGAGYAFNETRTVLNGGPGLDTITGNVSADTVYAQDGERDEISCGGNKDTVYFDAGIDVVNPATCERRISEPQ